MRQPLSLFGENDMAGKGSSSKLYHFAFNNKDKIVLSLFCHSY